MPPNRYTKTSSLSICDGRWRITALLMTLQEQFSLWTPMSLSNIEAKPVVAKLKQTKNIVCSEGETISKTDIGEDKKMAVLVSKYTVLAECVIYLNRRPAV